MQECARSFEHCCGLVVQGSEFCTHPVCFASKQASKRPAPHTLRQGRRRRASPNETHFLIVKMNPDVTQTNPLKFVKGVWFRAERHGGRVKYRCLHEPCRHPLLAGHLARHVEMQHSAACAAFRQTRQMPPPPQHVMSTVPPQQAAALSGEAATDGQQTQGVSTGDAAATGHAGPSVRTLHLSHAMWHQLRWQTCLSLHGVTVVLQSPVTSKRQRTDEAAPGELESGGHDPPMQDDVEHEHSDAHMSCCGGDAGSDASVAGSEAPAEADAARPPPRSLQRSVPAALNGYPMRSTPNAADIKRNPALKHRLDKAKVPEPLQTTTYGVPEDEVGCDRLTPEQQRAELEALWTKLTDSGRMADSGDMPDALKSLTEVCLA